MILPTVDEQAVASVVADWTGVPVGRMVKDEVETVLKLAELMNERVIGQKHALDMIAARIQTSRASLDNPNKPIGVFMLAGTSGVGKTETADGKPGEAAKAEPARSTVRAWRSSGRQLAGSTTRAARGRASGRYGR